jgi:transcription termination factor NusB
MAMAAIAAGGFFATDGIGGEVGFIEEFALSKNRAETLKQLIPGTEDFYYFHCLHHLNQEQFEKVAPLTQPWHDRFGQTARLTEIQTRHALLTYEKNSKQTLDHIKNRLGLGFNHQKEILGVPPNLPGELDPKLISFERLLKYSIDRWHNITNFEDSAIDVFNPGNQGYEIRRAWLGRLTRPDVPELPTHIAEDFKAPYPVAFGAIPIHLKLTLIQLDELLKLKPDLISNGTFVNAYLAKLQPGADENWKRDAKRTLAYLERLQSFVDKLPPVFNPLKAHVLYHRLVYDRSKGIFDPARFLSYIKLPRRQHYMSKALNESQDSNRYPADLNANYTGVTLLPIIGGDESLVRDYLKHFFLEAKGFKDYEAYINDTYLQHLFAETKIENGLGEPEGWANQLPPELFRALKDRIDIDFAHTNQSDYGVDEPVRLDLYVKNVPSLIVKIYEINAKSFYRNNLREIDTDINLDGLVANSEKVTKSDDSPFRRQFRRFEFPELSKAGVYIVDFIGNGKSSRALIRKGRLHPLVATGTAGQLVRVVDENHKPVDGASLWLSGKEYTAGKDGAILVPFSTAPGGRAIVLSKGEFSSLDSLNHAAEGYRFTAGIHVDRESLLAMKPAPIVIRPGLFLNEIPVSLKLLEDVKLSITSTDQNNIPSSTVINDFKLFEDRESVHEIRVPNGLKMLHVVLSAKVQSISTGNPVNLSVSHSVALNGIDATDRIEDLHFAKFGDEYAIELLGRTGEVKPDRPIHLSLKHRDFKEVVSVSLKSDAQGRIKLGKLTDITHVTATGPEGTAHTWPLLRDRHTYRQVWNAKAGETVTVPYLGSSPKPTREELALFEVRGSDFRVNKFDSLSIKNGSVEIQGLAAGDYDLWLKRSGDKIRIRVIDGDVQANHVLGSTRHMQVTPLKPSHIASITPNAETIAVKLRDASKFARVHVFATRYHPASDSFANLSKVRDAELSGTYPAQAESIYLTGRNIGDEYRYVLERKGQRKYPGNMLDRPMLLLNPWAVRKTETGEQEAQGGDDFRTGGGYAGSKPAAPMSPKKDGGFDGAHGGGDFADLDFLADATSVALNLLPDADGLVKIPTLGLAPHAMVHVLVVDPLTTTYRTITLPEMPARVVDLRLKTGLDPAKHFTQQKQVTVVPPGQPFTIADLAGSKFQSYDSLSKIFSYYSTLSKNPTLAEFSFVLKWPKMKIEEKRTLYSKYASHELNYFLFKKDPEFFAAVVRPYLENKKDPTFLDHWFLERDLSAYLNAWEYSRLNTVERVLLAQRIAGEPVKASRHFDDLLKLIPQNLETQTYQFYVGVFSDNLDRNADPTSGKLMEMQDKLRVEAAGKDMPNDRAAAEGGSLGASPVPTAAAPPGMPGGMGGMGGAPGAGGPGGPKAGAAGRGFRNSNGEQKELKQEVEMAKKAIESLEKRDGKGDRRARDEAEKLGDAEKKAEAYFEDGIERRKAVRQFYRKLDPTMEWAENNYYHRVIHEQLANLIPVGRFWLDFVRHDAKGPFLSRNLGEASRNFTEMMFALSVLDLPFEPAKHDLKFDGGSMTLTPGGHLIAFHEEVRPAEGFGGNTPILVSQNFYRHNDRYRDEAGERLDKFVTEEFVRQTVYGCQVVVTNPTSSRQKLTVLLQLPVGSIPVANGQFVKSLPLDLEPYRTQTIDYLFYFPKAGKYPHFPIHVAKNEKFVAAAQPFSFNVVEKPSKLDTGSWEYVSQNGTNDDVLAFLNRENVQSLNLEKIAFRMKDRGFFEAVTKLLDGRHLYHPTLWSYSILHGDIATARQFLQSSDNFVAECGGAIQSPLLSIDPVARHAYEHLEYKPLVNARAHSLGQRRQIVNDKFHGQYHAYLKGLSYHRELDEQDLLAATYYLLLQDRIDEATTLFAKVNPDKVKTKLQYDYYQAYLDMFNDEPKLARATAMKHVNHPVDRWRNHFSTIIAHLDEAEGKNVKVVDPKDRDQQQGALAATEPGFEFLVDNKAIQLTWQNLETVKVNYYLMDIELLFSRSPFVQNSGSQFSSIRPNLTRELKLPAGQSKLSVAIPDELLKRNVLVEITAGGKTRTAAYFANAMDVKFTESYGQVRVGEPNNGRGISKVYVKVYARMADGSVKFHKDGYTDLRGRFDYASVNTPERQAIERFAVLVYDENQGALIRDVPPPQK